MQDTIPQQFQSACLKAGVPLTPGLMLSAELINHVLAYYQSPMRVQPAEMSEPAIREIVQRAAHG